MKHIKTFESFSTQNIDPNNYPLAGPIVSGLEVMDKIDNMSSIRATLNDYKILPGVREIPMLLFILDDPKVSSPRIKNLANNIKESGQIMPLIVVFDKEGPYILEGSHRIDALNLLGVETLPALLVEDLSTNAMHEKVTHSKFPPILSAREMTDFLLENKARNAFGVMDDDEIKQTISYAADKWVLTELPLDLFDYGIDPTYKNKSKFPPIVIKDDNGDYDILDGRHRIGMAKSKGNKTIQVYLGE